MFIGRLALRAGFPFPTESVMSQGVTKDESVAEMGQLLRLHERLMKDLMVVRDELIAPTTKKIVHRFHARTGSNPEGVGPVTAAVEEAIRAIKLSEATLRKEMAERHDVTAVAGADNMPPALLRFIAERSQNPGFEYRVLHDENRGWVVRWKEYWGGRVRGSGQFYERPYAWLED